MEENNEQEVEKEDAQVKTEDTAANLNERFSPIAEANLAAKRLEDANKEKARLLSIEEKMIIERKLGGNTNAWQIPIKPKEETAAEYATRVMGERKPKM